MPTTEPDEDTTPAPDADHALAEALRGLRTAAGPLIDQHRHSFIALARTLSASLAEAGYTIEPVEAKPAKKPAAKT